MATIKSFTSLEQSRKLAEFLPIESADMCYKCIGEDPYDVVLRPYSEWREEYKGLLFDKEVDVIPCWSLASLLSVMPTYLFEFEKGIDFNVYPSINGNRWLCSYRPIYTDNLKTDMFRLITSKDNLIDACYEMILKLHELKML